jgi:hypothetical protein
MISFHLFLQCGSPVSPFLDGAGVFKVLDSERI